MKHCPECNRNYADPTISFCLEDGSPLVFEFDVDEPETAVLSGDPPSEASTRISKSPTKENVNSNATHIGDDIGRFKKRMFVGILGLFLAAAGIGFSIYQWSLRTRPFQTIQIAKLTNIGNATADQISPNGEYLAAVVYENGLNRIRNWDVKTKSFVDVVPPTEDLLSVASFSSDSKYIYFTRGTGSGVFDLYEIAVLGGTPARKILERTGNPSRSPDDQKWAFVRVGPNRDENSIIIANADGSNERTLIARKGNERFSVYAPSWSPDGKLLAIGVNTDGTNMKLATVSVDDGTLTPVADQTWLNVNRTAWLNDGSGIVFTANDESHIQVWIASYPDGRLNRITNDSNFYGNFSLSITADSSTIATLQIDRQNAVFVAPIENPTAGRMIVQAGGGALFYTASFVSWAPDGRIFYSSNVGGNSDIWVTDSNGSNIQHLVSNNAFDGKPIVSPDGRYIVFMSNRAGRVNLWRTDIDGSRPVQLTDGGYDLVSAFSPDGKWVIYESTASSDIRRVSIDGGEPVRLIEGRLFSPSLSPKDGTIAGRYRKDLNSPWTLALFSPNGGTPIKSFEIAPGNLISSAWTPDGRSIIYMINSVETSSLWSQSIEGGPPKLLADFGAQQVFSLSLSPDKKTLAYSRGSFVRNVVLITDTSRRETE